MKTKKFFLSLNLYILSLVARIKEQIFQYLLSKETRIARYVKKHNLTESQEEKLLQTNYEDTIKLYLKMHKLFEFNELTLLRKGDARLVETYLAPTGCLDISRRFTGEAEEEYLLMMVKDTSLTAIEIFKPYVNCIKKNLITDRILMCLMSYSKNIGFKELFREGRLSRSQEMILIENATDEQLHDLFEVKELFNYEAQLELIETRPLELVKFYGKRYAIHPQALDAYKKKLIKS